MKTGSNLKQVEKELIADVYINRNKTIVQALFSSPIFHGHQNLLIGEQACSSLAVTSRIFGFCGGSHQQAAVHALEHIAGATVPPNAHIVRSIIQAAEILQNSIKWFYTSFAPDLADNSFKNQPLYKTVCERFQAFKGTSFRKGIIGGTYPISLFSLVAGHWPHTEYIVPGGLATPLTKAKITKTKEVIQRFRFEWLEKVLLNGNLDQYLEIGTWEALCAWFDNKEKHRNSDLGLFFRTCIEYGLDEIGGGKNSFLSFGTFWKKEYATAVNPLNFAKATEFPSGIYNRKQYSSLPTEAFIEHLRNGNHLKSEQIFEQMKPYEMGSLARMLMQDKIRKSKNAPKNKGLIRDIFSKKGSSIFVRAFARLHEIMLLCNFIEQKLEEIELKGTFLSPFNLSDGVGVGMTEAPRGSLAHFVELRDHKIHKYQILAPTVYNINSGVATKKMAPLGHAMKGITIKNIEHPIEVGLIARSFDTCLRCTVNLKKSSTKETIMQVTV
ncbi:MAG: nickel-dependent hydrogenase large subunit [Bacteroidota bacterium]